MNSITCADCGRHRESRNKNTKYCRVCRLLRNVVYLGDRTYKCWLCEAPFAPLSANDRSCANCAYIPQSASQGECAFCHETKAYVDHDVAVCVACAKDPANRVSFGRALQKKIKAYVAEPVTA